MRSENTHLYFQSESLCFSESFNNEGSDSFFDFSNFTNENSLSFKSVSAYSPADSIDSSLQLNSPSILKNFRPLIDPISKTEELVDSSENIMGITFLHYKEIFDYLSEIESDEEIEQKVIDTTRDTLQWLYSHQITPPAVMAQEPDSFVLAWKVHQKSYAVVATNGKLGLIVRENRKTIRREPARHLTALRGWMLTND